jgi:hypothetical protein
LVTFAVYVNAGGKPARSKTCLAEAVFPRSWTASARQVERRWPR